MCSTLFPMKKTLELTVYPLLEKVGHWGLPGYIVDRKAVPLDTVTWRMEDRQLTDDQLGAIWWMLLGRRERMNAYRDGVGSATHDDALLTEERMDTVERFALRPHSSRNNYQ